ncbi:ABC transporter substrate-binding protein [Anaerosacchariphilus polymeriproducens]|uniref:Extracellular solute-binding protein n=1 Tax=Anaerosacchariphilus polymeriproducens TaxID=1812858 RepID=A0A371AVP4_9FIRM|nr:extracellular solute-binding protein [Anaerosacchariphilus polymeriproducens]RDU23646.1 extracellular solute-binding protein [Anaerosacchariphilus polymeriproducens]
MLKKNIVAMGLIFMLVTSLAGCGGKDKNTKTSDSSNDSIKQEMSDEDAETLYQQAIKEGGKLNVYSISSRMPKAAESFMEKYPEIKVEVYDLKQNEVLEKISREYKADIHTCDVAHLKDEDGSVWNEYVKNNILKIYYPKDICENIDSSYLETGMPLYTEMYFWYYNTEVYDKAPIDSWWDLTREEWRGKLITRNPQDDSTYMALFTNLWLASDELEASYKEEFGEDLVLSKGCKNAAEEFMYRFCNNDLIYAASSDEICEAVGTKGQDSAPIGLAASSKMRKVESDGYVMNTIENIKPFIGNLQINYLYTVDKSEHESAAKLFVRWLMGEKDGKGKGFEPFNTLGGWALRKDVETLEGNTPLTDINYVRYKADEVYNAYVNVEDFWISLQK